MKNYLLSESTLLACLKLCSIEQSRRGELLYDDLLFGETSMKAHGNRPSSTIAFHSGPKMTRARNFRAFRDGGFHEAGDVHSRRSVASLAGFSGPVKKNSLPVNQNGGKII
jgi:hypothetical protein